jgi:hypothetical protein
VFAVTCATRNTCKSHGRGPVVEFMTADVQGKLVGKTRGWLWGLLPDWLTS